MKNQLIINQFKLLEEQIIKDINDISLKHSKHKNNFRLLKIQNVIKIIKNLPYTIKSSNDIKHIKGVGSGTVKRVNEILKNGYLSELNKNNNNISKYLPELEQVIGIGKKVAYDLIINHGITTVDSLINAFINGNIDLNEQILIGLKYHGVYQQNIPRIEIECIDDYLHKKIKSMNKHLLLVICGSYRRNKDTSNDIDVLITHKLIKSNNDINSKHNYLLDLVNILKNDSFIVDDITFDKYKFKYMGFCSFQQKIRRIDIRYVPYNSFHTALLYFTGSGDFNQKLRKTAKSLGYTLNEYSLLHVKSNKIINVTSEKDVFDVLNLDYLPPEKR